MRINWRKYETLFRKLKYLQKYASRYTHTHTFLVPTNFSIYNAFPVYSSLHIQLILFLFDVYELMLSANCQRENADSTKRRKQQPYTDSTSNQCVMLIFFFSFNFGVLSGFGCAIQKLKRNDTSHRNNKFSHSQTRDWIHYKWTRLYTIRRSKQTIGNIVACRVLLATVIVQKYVTYMKLLCGQTDENVRINAHQSVVDLNRRCSRFTSSRNKGNSTSFWNNICLFRFCYNLVTVPDRYNNNNHVLAIFRENATHFQDAHNWDGIECF